MIGVAPMILGLAVAAGPNHRLVWGDAGFSVSSRKVLVRSGEEYDARIPLKG